MTGYHDKSYEMYMKDAELTRELDLRKALVVHFSCHARMDHPEFLFPDDMLNAIEHRNNFSLACSVVWPGHPMKLLGSVGIIFKPSVSSVLSVSQTDSGSTEEGSLGKPLTQVTLVETFNVKPGDHNEWRVKGAELKGIFIADPKNIEVRRQQLPAGPACSLSEERINSRTCPDDP
jgi:hypothetical protein